MSRTVSPVSGRPYGLARGLPGLACGRARPSTAIAPPAPHPTAARPGPVGPMPDAALVEAIRAVLTASPFHGEGHRKVWARLRLAGVRTSKRRVLRLMREHDLLAPSRVGAPRGPRTHDGTIIPETVDTMWGTDLTTTITGEGQAAVFVAVDHCSAECVGIHAAPPGHPLRGALEPIRQGVRRHFGGFAKDRARPVRPARPRQPVHAPTTSRRSSPSWASRARRPSCGPRRERLRRALHPHAEGEPAVGADLRHRRGAPSGAAGLPGDLQHDLADRAARVQAARRRPARPAFTRGPGRVGWPSVRRPWVEV